MKDIIGQEIRAGDDIIHTGGHHAIGKPGKVIKVHKKKVTIERMINPGTPYALLYRGSVFPDTLVVVTTNLTALSLI